MYHKVPEEIARGYIIYIVGNLYSYYPLYTLFAFITTFFIDVVLLAITLIIIQAGVARYNRKQSTVYHQIPKHHKRRTPKIMNSILYAILSYVQNYANQGMLVLEAALGSTKRKSTRTRKLRTKQYSKRSWRLRNTTQHKRQRFKSSRIIRKTYRFSEGESHYQSTMISANLSNIIISEGDNNYMTPSISHRSPIMHWLIYNRYMMQRYFSQTSIAYVTQKHDDDEDPVRATRFDTDSVPIRIDNCCSRSLSHDISDFIPDTDYDSPQRITIKGFGNSSSSILQCGTIQWRILDDNGNERNIIIPNSYYVPSSGVRLLSPQHWAQETSQVYNHGIVCITYGD
jgi:hypothetical protein